MEVLCGVKSDKGLERSANEDRLYADPQLGLYVVCDGMGGHNAGEIASQLAVEAIHERFHQAFQGSDPQMMGEYDPAFLPQTNWLASAVRYANHMIHCEAQENSQYDGMGTTVVSALLNGPVLSIAHVGDSRLYVIRGDSIEPLTADHSLVMEQVRAGLLTEEQAEHAEQSNVLTRALGVDPAVDVELGEVPVLEGDIFLLCSDGLTRMVSPRDILYAVRHAPDLQAGSERLIDIANAGGGKDNTTIILFTAQDQSGQSMWRRILRGLMNGYETVFSNKEETSCPK